MTVCIAVLCDEGRQIVAVSDHMLSMQDFTADGVALKNEPIHHNWFAMCAGDVSYVPAILECVGKQLEVHEEYEWMAIGTAFQNAYTAVLRSEINNAILARHNYTLDSFYKRGRNELTPSAFNELHRKIREFSIDAEFLIYGFDEHGDGHIFTFEDGITRSCDKAGMWAIGTGHFGALSTLFFCAKQYRFNQNRGVPAAIYASLAAKFLAESAEAVGEQTFLVVNRFNHEGGYVKGSFISKFRKQWFKRYAIKFPAKAMALLERNYEPGKQRETPKKK